MEESWGKQIEDILRTTNWKCPCPLLDRRNPHAIENRNELFELLQPYDKGLAQEIIWWAEGIAVYNEYPVYFMLLTSSLESVLPHLSSKDPVIPAIIEWRLKHGQDIHM